jgi:long-chain fatty acid transport protein
MQSKRRALASAAVILAAWAGPAWAGGIAVPEQSAAFLGTSFAGSAAGGDLSSMFWNPAALVTVPGFQMQTDITVGRESTNIQRQPGTSLPLLLSPDIAATSGNIFSDYQAVPASYASYQINRDLFIGLAINSPFGSSTHPANRNWAGLATSTSSNIATYDFNPTIAYRILPGFTVGVGAQIQYMSADLRRAFPLPIAGLGMPLSTSPTTIVNGLDHWAFGFTAGALWQPTQTTQIGFGYRSGINEDLKGQFKFDDPNPLLASATALVDTPVHLPAIATASIRQDLTPTFALLGTAQWTQWSNLQNLTSTCQSGSSLLGSPVCVPGSPVGGNPIPFHWHDGWFFSAGAEQKLSPSFLLRAGVAYERSPVQSADENKVSILDSDRIWASTGLEYKVNRMMTLDLSYAHVFFYNSNVVDSNVAGTLTVVGTTQRDADILAASLTMRFDPPPPAPKIVK